MPFSPKRELLIMNCHYYSKSRNWINHTWITSAVLLLSTSATSLGYIYLQCYYTWLHFQVKTQHKKYTQMVYKIFHFYSATWTRLTVKQNMLLFIAKFFISALIKIWQRHESNRESRIFGISRLLFVTLLIWFDLIRCYSFGYILFKWRQFFISTY